MKKKLFGIIMVAIVAVAAAWNVCENKNEVNLTDLALSNVEALANEEWGRGSYCQWDDTNKECTRLASGPVCLLTAC